MQKVSSSRTPTLRLSLSIAAYMAGQGSLFVLQTALLRLGRFELVSSLTISLSTFAIGQLLVDQGGSILLAGRGAGTIRKVLWWLVPVRLMVALACITSIYFLPGRWYPGAGKDLVQVISIGLLPWSFNISGYVDARENVLFARLVNTFPSLGCALGSTIYLAGIETTFAVCAGTGLVLGSCFAVLIQLRALHQDSEMPSFEPAELTIKKYFPAAVGILSVALPSLMYGNAVLTFVIKHLAQRDAALFSYLRTVYVGFSQVAVICTRVNLNGVLGTQGNPFLMEGSSFRLQLTATAIAISFFVVGYFALLYQHSITSLSLLFLCCLSFSVVSYFVSTYLQSVLQIRGIGGPVVAFNLAALCIGGTILVLLLPVLGVFGFAISESGQNLSRSIALWPRLRKS